jgi:hypothetical protein
MAAVSRKIVGLAVGVLAFLGRTRDSRRQRRRALRDQIYRDYDVAGSDPEFQEEMRQVNADFDGTLGDGLEEWAPAG